MSGLSGRAAGRPLTLRGVLLRNRVVAAPMERNYCDLAGRATQRYVDYLGARAAGGAALVFTESSYVSQVSKARPHQMGMHDDAVVPALRAVADAVHAGGALLGVELNHAGRVVPSTVSQQVPVAPSAVACREIGGELPHALSEAEVQDVVHDFAEAARRAVRGGADVISVHGAHGYLIGQFLSPRSNLRTDRYGQPTAFLTDVVRAVRGAVGEKVPVFLRLSAFEGLPGGLDVEASLALVDQIPLDAVDVLDLSAGTYGAGHWITPSGEVAEGYLADIAARYRRRSGLPVSVAGRVVSPDVAERLLDCGAVDLVASARALHADPAWARHVVEGTQPRPCIACNQGCADVIFTGRPLWCAANPGTGREGRARPVVVRDRPPTVAVVGGGPAGLQAAHVLASGGARVVLHERSAVLGGQHALASRLRAKPQFGRLLTWFTAELARLHVEVRLASEPDPGEVLHAVDGVVLALGAEDYLPQVPGVDHPRVVGIRRWLQERSAEVEHVAVWGADRAAVYVADDLASRGVEVTLIARADGLATDAGARERLHAVERLHASAAVRLHLGAVLTEVLPATLRLSTADGVSEVAAAGPVLVSQGAIPAEGWQPWSTSDGTPVERAVGPDLATFDAALRYGQSAAERLLLTLSGATTRATTPAISERALQAAP
ncbi:FAD-dependent oxidoreductase [Aquipuribacter nitratireducens]|uniref:oxidoreductase n=1 Tax=Aquipuribacter nitratireducens TaxID=650104 RepID=UPI0030EEC325